MVLIASLVLTNEAIASQRGHSDAEVMATVDAAVSAAQSGNLRKLRDQYATDCVFIDEFAPFHWSGPNAIDNYLASAARMYKQTQHGDVRMTVRPPIYVYVSGDDAYLVEPLSEKAIIRGKAYKSTGFLTFTLARISHVWKITSQIWSKTSENMNPY
jgi:hypothetical protein